MGDSMTSNFQVLCESTKSLARTGKLVLKSGRSLQTPTFLASTSRGVIPHLTPDNVAQIKHSIPGTFAGAEDFLDALPNRTVPFLQAPVPIRELLCLPEETPIVLSTRRSLPVPSPQPNGNEFITIMTSEGNRKMPTKTYYEFSSKFKPDVLLSPADIPNLSPGGRPGNNRRRNMLQRSEKWLNELVSYLEENKLIDLIDIFAPVLPGISFEHHKQYLDKINDSLGHHISGVAFWSSRCGRLSEKQAQLELKRHSAKTDEKNGDTLELDLGLFSSYFPKVPRLYSTGISTPQGILDFIINGMDIVVSDCVGGFTDAGVALDFTFPVPNSDADRANEAAQQQPQVRPLGYNLWDPNYVTDMSELGCLVPTRTGSTYTKAYINHLLNAKEMTAWVILQSHNFTVMNNFYEGIRTSINKGMFEKDRETFIQVFGGRENALKLRDQFKAKDTVPKARGYSIGYGESIERQAEGTTTRLNDPRFKKL